MVRHQSRDKPSARACPPAASGVYGRAHGGHHDATGYRIDALFWDELKKNAVRTRARAHAHPGAPARKVRAAHIAAPRPRAGACAPHAAPPQRCEGALKAWPVCCRVRDAYGGPAVAVRHDGGGLRILLERDDGVPWRERAPPHRRGPSRATSAPRSLRRALLMPQVNTGSRYRCGKRA